jgi:peroxiredoxin
VSAKRWLAVAALALAVGVGAELLSGNAATGARAAPPLPSRALQKPAVSVAGLRGKPALVAYFASWCGPCAEDAKTLRRVAASVGGRARVVAVDWDDEAAAARAFVHRHHWPFTVLADPGGSAGESYGINGLPTSFVLDSEGRIVATLRGPQPASLVRADLLAAG